MQILNSSGLTQSPLSQLRSASQPQTNAASPEAEQKASEARNTNKAQDTVLNRLAEHIPGMTAEDLRQQKAEDFTPDKVAERISGYVGMGLANARAEGRSEEDIQKMHAAAMRGIEKGFNEAKEILDGLSILGQGNIEKTIDDTFDKTMSAVKALLPGQESLTPSAPIRAASEFYAAERYSKAETFSLKLQTQEGDDVVIEFGRANSQSASIGGVSNANGSAISAGIERSSASSMYFSVQGDLNEDEMAAINDLLKDVNEIADEFFSGDIQAAFDKAVEFEMDGSQLASMNLRLTRTESYSAASAYSNIGNSTMPGLDALSPLKDMGSKMAALAEDPKTAFLQEADKLISTILDSLVEQDIRYKDADGEQRERFDNSLAQMHSMLDSLFDREPQPAVEAPQEAADASA